jgi:DNA mismatch repair protein MSH2
MPADIFRDKIQDTLQMCEVDFSFSADRKDWDHKDVHISLEQLLKTSFSFMIEESRMELALQALNAAIETMKLKNYGEQAKNKYTLAKYTLDQYLRLDVAALKALNVFPSSQAGDVGSVSGQAGSLYGLLNQCKTQIGARLLKKWLK